MDRFESPKLLLRHSRSDFEEFVAACGPFFQRTRQERVIGKHPDTGQNVLKIKFTFGMPDIPEQVRTLAFDIANNLRLALDQAFVTSLESLTRIEEDHLTFPIRTDPNDLKGTLNIPRKKSAREILRIPEELHPILTSFEPYPTGEGYPGGNDLLCAVCNLVAKKHKVVLKPRGVVHNTMINSMSVRGGLSPIMRWDGANNEFVIGVLLNGEVDYGSADVPFKVVPNSGNHLVPKREILHGSPYHLDPRQACSSRSQPTVIAETSQRAGKRNGSIGKPGVVIRTG